MYENDDNIIPYLKSNCKYLIKNSTIPLKIDLVEKNFILDNNFDMPESKFDLIISNPPFKKISKKTLESQKMLNIVYGSPNLYFLFIAMSLHLLKSEGELVFITPRSWTSGVYFKKFRKYLLDNAQIDNMHLFLKRKDLYNHDSILQESMIIKLVKSINKNAYVNVTSSKGDNFDNITDFKLPYNLAISKNDNNYVFLPVNQKEVEILKIVNNFDNTLLI